ncbi:hypothetical protein AVEN_125727-1 [Araneus ventricosus]|uniref:Uncharacterized protein n=1 Tax=Araneus ventricosus TaxID=182803 RepID=A0A4Y2WKD5_ARAVE|nr:hypothetical protein AVEN_125727-1 [Araneus ventricosus]
MLMTGSALSLSSKKSLDVPNYLQVILASYKVPKGVFQKQSETQKMEASDAGQSIPSQMDSLLQLRRDLYHAYNLTYQIRDPIGRILYRNEHSDGAGSLRGSMNFAKDNGSKMTVINYSLQVEEHPTSSPELAFEKMHKPSMRSSAEGNQMTEESSSQEEGPRTPSQRPGCHPHLRDICITFTAGWWVTYKIFSIIVFKSLLLHVIIVFWRQSGLGTPHGRDVFGRTCGFRRGSAVCTLTVHALCRQRVSVTMPVVSVGFAWDAMLRRSWSAKGGQIVCSLMFTGCEMVDHKDRPGAIHCHLSCQKR